LPHKKAPLFPAAMSVSRGILYRADRCMLWSCELMDGATAHSSVFRLPSISLQHIMRAEIPLEIFGRSDRPHL